MAKGKTLDITKVTDLKLAQVVEETYGQLLKFQSQLVLVNQELEQRQSKLNELELLKKEK